MGNISRFIRLLIEQVNWKFNLIYIEMKIIRIDLDFYISQELSPSQAYLLGDLCRCTS